MQKPNPRLPANQSSQALASPSIIVLSILVLIALGGAALLIYGRVLREPQLLAGDSFLLYSGVICIGSLSLPPLVGGLVRWSRKRRLGIGVGLLLVLGILPLFASIHIYIVVSNYKSNCVSRAAAGAVLTGCNLAQVSLSGMNLTAANLENAELTGVDLAHAELSQANFRRSDLRDVKLNGANLAAASFVQARLTNVDLTDAMLDQANFTGARLVGVNMSGTTLTNVAWENAVLTDTNFTDATLDHVNFKQVSLYGADMTGATLSNLTLLVVFLDVSGVSDAQWADALGVSQADLSAALSLHKVSFERIESISESIKGACQGQAVPGAGAYSPDGRFHAAVVMSASGDDPIWAGGGWQPAALRFVDLVACVQDDEGTSAIQTCQYTGGPPITRYQYHVTVRLIDAATGELAAEKSVFGKPPDACPETAKASIESMYGERVSHAEISDWLLQFVNPPQ